MAYTKYILPSLAMASYALAATCSGTANITSQSDADGLSTCSKYSGTIVISKDAAGTIALNGIKQITGDLTSESASGLNELSAGDLTSIGGQFSLNGLTGLTSLSMTSLTSVDTIFWEALPLLQHLTFTKGVATATNVRITNTGLTTLDGISLQTVGDFQIDNNFDLAEINVNEITNITGALTFAANNDKLKISFPNLVGAQNITIRNASSVDIPSLEKLQGSLGFYSNFFDTFAAANLTSVGESLVFNDNGALTNISLPALTTVGGGFQIANNSKLETVNGFTKLQEVDGALDFTGDFNNVTLSSLKLIRGNFNMQSSGQIDCSQFDSLHPSVIKGKYTCASNKSDPTSLNGHSSGTSTGSSSSATSTGFAVPAMGFVPKSMTWTAVIGTLLGLAL